MSGRFVRSSKFRHVFGAIAKKDKAYQNVKPNLSGEGNFIAASVLYTAVPITGGGGPVQIIKNGAYEKFGTTVGKLNSHKAPVLDCTFAPYDACLLATGDDVGQVNVSRLPEIKDLPDTKDVKAYADCIGAVEPVAVLPDCPTKKVAILGWNPNVKGILGGVSFDNTVKIWDVEANKNIINFEQPDLPYYFDWNSDGSRIAVTRKDKFVCIIDPRDNKSEIKAEGLDAKPNRCVWADPVHKLIVTGSSGGSRVLRVYDPRKFDKYLQQVDIDQGGSVLCPYYDADTSMVYLPGKGDATVRYYEVTEKDENESFCFPLSEFRDNESAKGGCFLPKSACDTKICEVAIFYRLLKDWVSPVSFTVPRKSEMFQSDIFPDTYAGPSYHSAGEYMGLKGDWKHPSKRSMKDNKPEAHVASKRTKADIEKELEAAQNKVKALTAELASFKA